MVDVQDNEHITIDSIINSLLNIVHPCIIYMITIAVLFKMLIPGHRYTNSVEACFLDCLELSCIRCGHTPLSCILLGWRTGRYLGIVRIKRITEVPADLHLGNDVPWTLTGKCRCLDICDRQRSCACCCDSSSGHCGQYFAHEFLLHRIILLSKIDS